MPARVVASEAEAILGDYPEQVARDGDVRRAALALDSARVCQVDPNSVVAFELGHIEDIVRALPYAVEAAEQRRALRYEREASGLYRGAFLRAVAAATEGRDRAQCRENRSPSVG